MANFDTSSRRSIILFLLIVATMGGLLSMKTTGRSLVAPNTTVYDVGEDTRIMLSLTSGEWMVFEHVPNTGESSIGVSPTTVSPTLTWRHVFVNGSNVGPAGPARRLRSDTFSADSTQATYDPIASFTATAPGWYEVRVDAPISTKVLIHRTTDGFRARYGHVVGYSTIVLALIGIVLVLLPRAPKGPIEPPRRISSVFEGVPEIVPSTVGSTDVDRSGLDFHPDR